MNKKKNAAWGNAAQRTVETKDAGSGLYVSDLHLTTARAPRQPKSKGERGLRHISELIEEWLQELEERRIGTGGT